MFSSNKINHPLHHRNLETSKGNPLPQPSPNFSKIKIISAYS